MKVKTKKSTKSSAKIFKGAAKRLATFHSQERFEGCCVCIYDEIRKTTNRRDRFVAVHSQPEMMLFDDLFQKDSGRKAYYWYVPYRQEPNHKSYSERMFALYLAAEVCRTGL